MSSLRFAVGVALVLLSVALLYALILGPRSVPSHPSPPELATPSPPSKPHSKARLVDATGRVEARGPGRSWRAVHRGDAIHPDEDLRTRANGRALIDYRDGVSVQILPDTELGVREDGDVLRLVVSEGVAIADVRAESRTRVRITNATGAALAEVTDGRVGVLVDREGRLETAVTRGQATLRAGGEAVAVREGFRSVVGPGGFPSPPTELPRSLLLKVRWPERATSKRRQWVAGTTNPGTRVRVGQTIVRADERGRFEAVVELEEGVNTIGVFALDASGRERRANSPDIELDTQAPATTVETDPSMWE